MKFSEAAQKVISLARDVRRYYDTELPKWHPNYPLIDPATTGPPPPKEEIELEGFLRSLPPETIFRLVLVMYLGRGDFGVEDLRGNYETLKQKFGEPKRAISQMLAKAPLGDYLDDGLSELQSGGISADELLAEETEAAKP